MSVKEIASGQASCSIEIDDRDTRAQLQKAQAGLREVQEAQEEIEQNIHAAESAREAAEAGRSLALATFNRYKALLEQKSVSQQEFDEVQAKMKIAEAEVDRAGRMLQALMAKKSQVLAKVEQVKADITSAQVYVGYGRILSPMNGIVVSKQAEIGLLAAPGVPLLTLEDNSRYRLEVSVEDSMLRQIRLGTPVSDLHRCPRAAGVLEPSDRDCSCFRSGKPEFYGEDRSFR